MTAVISPGPHSGHCGASGQEALQAGVGSLHGICHLGPHETLKRLRRCPSAMPRLIIIQATGYRSRGRRIPNKLRKRRLVGAVLPYLAALVITMAIAYGSMLYHTFKASRINPADSLRYE